MNNTTIIDQNSHNMQKININECLAKTFRLKNNQITPGRTVHSHCLIVGLVAQQLLNRYPKWLIDLFFPKGSNLISACHDIGKLSPSFQRKIYDKLTSKQSSIWPLIKDNQFHEREIELWGGHAGISKPNFTGFIKKVYNFI